MRFIIDAQLPPSLASFFNGHDVIHTSALNAGNLTPDAKINELSKLEGRIMITKDSDFFYTYISTRKPYKLVMVKLGNMRLRELKGYFERNTTKIIELLEEYYLLILEPERIRILE